ncbi:hypothetical protein SMD44_08340 [Streptomyces alboflavus]|uniref:Uncharacterized protein n=1 Tax=Streptomyces alboflavus TaxID=67267 RepID=A0A1Z1WQX8_9ACTN|nr:hypothetical protein SMD44_08340 [Streptomyces alboflavus]
MRTTYQAVATMSSGTTRAVAAVDHLHLVEQLADRHHRDDRGPLEERDDLVGGVRQDRAHRLRQHDPAHLPQAGDAERGGRLQLARLHGEESPTQDLGGVRGLVQREADDGGGHGADEMHGAEAPHDRAEGDADPQLLVQIGKVEPEQQLHDERDGTERPHVQPGDAREERAAGEPHQGDDETEGEAERRAVHRQLQRHPDGPQHAVGQQIAEEDLPLPRGVGDQTVGELREQDEDGDAGGPAPVVAGGDDDGVGDGGRRGGRFVGRRPGPGTRLLSGIRSRCGTWLPSGTRLDLDTHGRPSCFSNGSGPMDSGSAPVSKRGVYPVARYSSRPRAGVARW